MILARETVDTPDGPRPISSLGRGDRITILKNHALRPSAVDRIVHGQARTLIRIETDDGASLVGTSETELYFMTLSGRQKRVHLARVKPGDRLMGFEAGQLVVRRVAVAERILDDPPQPLCSIETPFYDRYLAGGLLCRG